MTFKLDFQKLSKPTFTPKPKLFDCICEVCGKTFKAKRRWAKTCDVPCRMKKLREKKDPERKEARERCKGKCEACRKPSDKLFFRSTDQGKKMLCGKCNSVYSQDKFHERVGDPKATRTKLWARVQHSLDEIPARTGGVYLIRCKKNGNEFIGSAKNVLLMCKKHIEALQVGEHPNTFLQSEWTEFGRDEFEFRLLRAVSDFDTLQNKLDVVLEERKPAYNLQ